jgi:HPt (histidine-containing phosphotransfer) domain-containing protein
MPIVALTADAIAATERHCLDVGMDAVVTKPVQARRLENAVARWLPEALALRRRRGAETRPAVAIGAPAAPGPRPGSLVPVLDQTRLAETFGDFNDEARGFLRDFAEDAAGMIDKAERALAAGQSRLAREEIHALKGAALSLGATALGSLAGDVQDMLDRDDAGAARASIPALRVARQDLAWLANQPQAAD